jgi:hypothetical protein
MIRGAALLTAVVAAAALAATAGAQGKPSQGCAPGFDLGELTFQEFVALPRIVASIADGFTTESDVLDHTPFWDKNGDGLLCVQDTPGAAHSSPASLWQYLYNITDNNASKPDA